MSGFTPEMREKAAEARRVAAAMRRANIEAAGIPESRRFGGDPAADENPILKCHVGGMLVADMPVEIQGRILYQQTDEGIVEANASRTGTGAAVVSDGFSKALQQRRDDITERDMDSYQARDPLKEVADAHAVPGMRPKFLSARRVKENGGTGDYQVVKEASGDPVTVRGMILGHIPERRAVARNKHYQERSRTQIKEIAVRYKEEGGASAVTDQ